MTSISGTRVIVNSPTLLGLAPGLAILLAISQLAHGAPFAAAVLTVRPAQGQDRVHRGAVRQAQQRQHLRLAPLPTRRKYGAEAGRVDAQQQVLYRGVDGGS